MLEKLDLDNHLLGRFNYQKGLLVEYLILEQLRLHGCDKNTLLKSITRNLPEDFNFCEYSRVWRYDSSPEYTKRFSVDIFARAVNRVVGFIFSRSGFTKEAEEYCREKGIACSDDDKWLETGKLKPTLV